MEKDIQLIKLYLIVWINFLFCGISTSLRNEKFDRKYIGAIGYRILDKIMIYL